MKKLLKREKGEGNRRNANFFLDHVEGDIAEEQEDMTEECKDKSRDLKEEKKGKI